MILSVDIGIQSYLDVHPTLWMFLEVEFLFDIFAQQVPDILVVDLQVGRVHQVPIYNNLQFTTVSSTRQYFMFSLASMASKMCSKARGMIPRWVAGSEMP